MRSSRIPPFIWLCDEEQARPARQKISKIRRVARGTVCPGAPSRIYKERSHDLCRGLGYLSISMVHAIPLHGYRYVLASNARSPGSFLFFFFFFSSPSFPLSFLSIFPTGFRVLSGNVKFSTLHFLKKREKKQKTCSLNSDDGTRRSVEIYALRQTETGRCRLTRCEGRKFRSVAHDEIR